MEKSGGEKWYFQRVITWKNVITPEVLRIIYFNEYGD